MALGGIAKGLRRLILGLCFLALFVAPILTWFAYPPVRVLMPGLAPIMCDGGKVCVDDPTLRPRAQALYDEALFFVNSNVGRIEVAPRVYFCSTQACSDHFGWDGTAGYNVGTFGAVI